MRTPWAPVSITAAYGDPGLVPAVRISPAFAHGCTGPGRAGHVGDARRIAVAALDRDR